MSSERREVLKMIAGAGAFAALGSMTASSQSNADADKPTYVILNGAAGLVLRDKDLLCFLPNIASHKYIVGAQQISSPIAQEIQLTAVTPDSPKSLFDYSAYGYVYVPASDNFKYDPNVPPFVKVSLPYPKEIYPHRLLNVALQTSPGAALRGPLGGALVLEYAPGKAPAMTGLPSPGGVYSCPKSCAYYQILIAAYNPDSHMPPEVHARNAWAGLAAHFPGMYWQLTLSGNSQAVASSLPGGMTDLYIEQQTVGIEDKKFDLLVKGIADRKFADGVFHAFATAANCKSPLFTVDFPR